MEVIEIAKELASPVMSIVAILISIFKKGKLKTAKTKEQIVDEAQAKYAKYIKKQCAKNGIEKETENG